VPRGRPKKGQFELKLWFPQGGSVQMRTMRDMPDAEWRDELRKAISILTNAANDAEDVGAAASQVVDAVASGELG
jgi:hypothetical protein